MDKIALTAHNAKRTDRYIQYQANPIGMYAIKPTLQYIRSGHFSDRTFFCKPSHSATFEPALCYKYRQSVCLSPSDTSFVHFIALFERAATSPGGQIPEME